MHVNLYAITVGLFIHIYMYALVIFSVFSKTYLVLGQDQLGTYWGG